MNPALWGIALRASLQFLGGAITAYSGYQITQPEVDAVVAVAEGALGVALTTGAGIALSVKNKRRLGAL